MNPIEVICSGLAYSFSQPPFGKSAQIYITSNIMVKNPTPNMTFILYSTFRPSRPSSGVQYNRDLCQRYNVLNIYYIHTNIVIG